VWLSSANQVDLKKIRDIRWVLKRRYMKARNFQRIFNYWDMDNKGSVTVQNIYNMCKRLGINANPLECQVILASADPKGKGELGPDDFLDLIYNDIDVLKLNPNRFKNSAVVEEEGVDEIKAKLQASAKEARDNKKFNQMKLILKNRVKELKKEFGFEVHKVSTGHRRGWHCQLFSFRKGHQTSQHH
jgi:hypothetical protein